MLVEKFKKICMVLGAKFEQDSIFFAEKGQAKLIYTRDIMGSDGKVEHHKGEIVPLGAFHPQTLGMAFTKIKGKTFSFEWLEEAMNLGLDSSSEPMSMDQEMLRAYQEGSANPLHSTLRRAVLNAPMKRII